MEPMAIQGQLARLGGVGQLGGLEIQPIGEARPEADGGFGALMAEQIDKVNQTMQEADRLSDELARGKSGNVHGTLIALQKADLSFRMLLEVRNKVMKAYEEVMRMQA